MSTYASLRFEVRDGIADVVLTGPAKGNAMGPDMWRELAPAFEALDADPLVRAIVLSGSGKHFTYGLDLMGMMPDLAPLVTGNPLAAQRAELRRLIGRMQRAITAVELCSKPVIAAVHGWCIGGGIDLITACDIRLCSADAKFSVREVKLAIVADIGTLQRLPGIVGEGYARELALTGRDFDASEAQRIGLVNRVHADPEALRNAAREVAAEIAANPPLTVAGIKHVMNHARDHGVQEGLDYVAGWNAAMLQSEDLAEAVAAFVERRPPKFTGR